MRLHRIFDVLLGLTLATILGLFSWAHLSAQSTGTLTPVPILQLLDENGVPLAGGFIYTYGAGGSTSAVTYQDAGLTTAHANPIVLDSAGRATVYLAQAGYKFIVANSANVTQYTTDNLQSTAYSAAQATIIDTCDYRITLTSATPVPASDVTAATTVYVTPYHGNRCALYDGSTWNVRNFTELSLSLGSDAANTNYDLFAYDNAGVMALERLAWATGSTRATALTTQDGVPVKSGVVTRRYLGTYRTTGTAGQTEDSVTKRFVWNYKHRMARPLKRSETSDSWTYTTASFRQANANTQNVLQVLTGISAESVIDLFVNAIAENTGTSANVYVTVGIDDSTAVGSGCFAGLQRISVASVPYQVMGGCRAYVALGSHSYFWLEQSTASGTTTWTGDGGSSDAYAGIYGVLSGS